MDITRGTTSAPLQGVLRSGPAGWAAAAPPAPAQGDAQGGDGHHASQARAAQKPAQGKPTGAKGTFQHKKRGLRVGGSH